MTNSPTYDGINEVVSVCSSQCSNWIHHFFVLVQLFRIFVWGSYSIRRVETLSFPLPSMALYLPEAIYNRHCICCSIGFMYILINIPATKPQKLRLASVLVASDLFPRLIDWLSLGYSRG